LLKKLVDYMGEEHSNAVSWALYKEVQALQREPQATFSAFLIGRDELPGDLPGESDETIEAFLQEVASATRAEFDQNMEIIAEEKYGEVEDWLDEDDYDRNQGEDEDEE
jgi:hypothetical protein